MKIPDHGLLPVRRRAVPVAATAAALLAVLLAFLAAASCSGRGGAAAGADLILVNGAVHTMDRTNPKASAVASSGGRIVYVGSDKGALGYKGAAARVIDLHGKMVLPGFQDSHIHLVTGGLESGQCSLTGLKTREQVFEKIKAYAAANPALSWVTGGGWELPVFPRAEPSREDLDRLVPDRPALLSSADGHSAWVNSRALEAAGVTAATPDPPGGRIERDPATGRPSGTLRESASGLVESHVPVPGPEEYVKGLEEGLRRINRFGITSIIEARADEKVLETYIALDRAGKLTARILASLDVDSDKGPADILRLEDLRRAANGDRLKAGAAKIFVDGVMEPGTAALLEPYTGSPGSRGTPLIGPGPLDSLVTALDAAGFQVHIHAIGDRAVRMSLDAFQAAARTNGAGDLRHHIAHLELIDPADIPRFRALNVTANFQALWAWPDPYITDLTLPILGPARSRWLYPIGSVSRTGAVIVGGSDWPVSSENPLEAIETAVTRSDPGLPPTSGWIPEEKVDLETMLRAYTVNGAWLAHEEGSRGSLTVGQAADIIVLDRDLFAVPASEISEARVLLTLLAGRAVYRDPAF